MQKLKLKIIGVVNNNLILLRKKIQLIFCKIFLTKIHLKN